MTARRAADIAYVAGIALGVAVLFVFGFLAARDRIVGSNDFTYMWAGARTLVDGGDPYVPGIFPATARAYHTILPAEAVFCYPPWVLIALVPLALLPVPIASGIWTFGGMALAAVALRALLRSVAPDVPVAHFAAGLALFASQPGSANVWSGQWGFILVAALAATVVALRQGRSLVSLAAFGLLAKPHLVVLAFPAFARAANARWGMRFLVVLAAPLVAAVGLAWAVFPDWLPAFRDSLIAQRFASQPPTTLENGLADLVGPAGHLLAGATVIALVSAGLRFAPRSDAFIAVWLGISFTTQVYGWSYDHVLLLVPLVIATGVLAAHSARNANLFAAIALGSFLIAPTLMYVIADARQNESFSIVIPLAVTLACIGALWAHRREGISAPEPARERVAAGRLASL